MNANSLKFIRSAGLVAGSMLALSNLSLFAAEKAPATDAFPNFESYIKVSGQAPSISGDSSAFANRAREAQNGSGGIEDMHIAKDLSKDTALTFDGRALAGTEDYLAQLKLTKNKVGSIDVGYKRFRTFYDGVGGFFSNNPVNFYGNSASYYGSATASTINGQNYLPTASYVPFQKLSTRDLHLDRSKFWVNATLAMPDMPVFSVKYTNELRNGQKDSTIWGQTDFTSLPTAGYLLNPISSTRATTPSWIDIGERHENLEASVSHSLKNIAATLTVFTDKTKNLDTRYVTRYPGEVKIFAVPATVLVGKLLSSVNVNNQIDERHTDGSATKTNGVTGHVDVTLSSKLKLKFAGVYENVTNDFTGSRQLTTYMATNPAVIPTGITSVGVVPVVTNLNQGLAGTAKIKELSGSLALEWKPATHTFVKLGLKEQKEWLNADGGYTRIGSALNATTGAITYTTVAYTNFSRLNQNGTTPVGEIRYTGIKNVAFYATASSRDLNGSERNIASYNLTTLATSNPLQQTPTERHDEYTVGANWRVSPQLTLRGEVFEKRHKNGFSGLYNNVYNLYELDIKYTGYKLTAVAKASDALSLTTRLVTQKGEGRTKGTAVNVVSPTQDSLASKNYQISETIDFSPTKSWYAQLAGNLVYHDISTIYPRAGVYPANTTANPPVGAYDVNRVFQNSENNYYTISAMVGAAVAKHTDLQFQHVEYKAANGNGSIGLYAEPFGVACKDSTTTVGIRHMISPKLVMNAKVGYIDSKNDTTGGYTNYRGPMAYLAFDHAF